MSFTRFKGMQVKLSGNLPGINHQAPAFKAVKKDLTDAVNSDYTGKKVILNIFPSLDTPVCATSVRRFNQFVNDLPDTVCLCISRDLPFAQARFCGAEGLDNVVTLSDFRYSDFGRTYGLEMVEGPLQGLLARAVIILDQTGQVIYSQLVEDIVQEPDYEKALAALK